MIDKNNYPTSCQEFWISLIQFFIFFGLIYSFIWIFSPDKEKIYKERIKDINDFGAGRVIEIYHVGYGKNNSQFIRINVVLENRNKRRITAVASPEDNVVKGDIWMLGTTFGYGREEAKYWLNYKQTQKDFDLKKQYREDHNHARGTQ